MGCSFLACFSASKNRKHQHLVDGDSSVDQVSFLFTFTIYNSWGFSSSFLNNFVQSRNPKPTKEEDFWKPFNPIIVEKEKLGELLNNGGKHQVAFDLNVESSDKLLENEENKGTEGTVKGSGSSVLDLSAAAVVCKFQNNRYQNSEESGDALKDLDLEVKEVESGEKEVSSPMRIVLNRNAKDKGGECLQSVLNPIENLAQWKGVKAKAGIPLKDEEKENINVEQAGVGPENTANSKGSTDSVGNSAASQKTNLPRSYEDRPILGALTLEEFKQHSASRKCRSQSPDETPIIGTVGSYWNHTGQIVDADSSSLCKGTPRTRCRNIQEERSKWNAIPFEARLERALDTGTAGV
ncbi:hypothetical protein HRI_000243300 [Hibiscus trionum]|uniref:Uncharacterized protein n=1 Tax=Hibiscus trionum TaxID=183268 RepID=A0A9W7GXA8_HIBTR|nr:hypothetical protein HRI_000243300 [Hibiscus trionum]